MYGIARVDGPRRRLVIVALLAVGPPVGTAADSAAGVLDQRETAGPAEHDPPAGRDSTAGARARTSTSPDAARRSAPEYPLRAR